MFLVKIKAHRGEPLNERADDLVDEGKTLAKAGESYQWKDRTTRLVYSCYDRAAQWKKGTWSKTIRNAARRGAAESLSEALKIDYSKERTNADRVIQPSNRAYGRDSR